MIFFQLLQMVCFLLFVCNPKRVATLATCLPLHAQVGRGYIAAAHITFKPHLESDFMVNICVFQTIKNREILGVTQSTSPPHPLCSFYCGIYSYASAKPEKVFFRLWGLHISNSTLFFKPLLLMLVKEEPCIKLSLHVIIVMNSCSCTKNCL